VLKKNIWATFQRIVAFFNQKFVTKLSKIWVGIRDPGSGINLFQIPDPGVKKAPDSGSGSVSLLDPIRIPAKPYTVFDKKILLNCRYLVAMEGAEPSLPLLVVGANLLDVMLATADQKVDSFKQHLLENFIKVLTHSF
jgi:hypothetical protein